MIGFYFLHPLTCDPPHRISHEEKLADLADEFVTNGWSPEHPVLIGYVLDGRVQLLSGTHRHAAANYACIALPVLLRPYAEIEQAWGTEHWAEIMTAPLLRECQP